MITWASKDKSMGVAIENAAMIHIFIQSYS